MVAHHRSLISVVLLLILRLGLGVIGLYWDKLVRVRLLRKVTWDCSKHLTFTLHLMHTIRWHDLVVADIRICFTLLKVLLGLC